MLTQDDILNWLREDDPNRLDYLFKWADNLREANVGAEVHLRGLIEVSNYCDRGCFYCGLRLPNVELPRYRMESAEVVAAAVEAQDRGYGTVVLQAGEDPDLDSDWVCDVVRQIKHQTHLAVTLSLGERNESELLAMRRAGADRYLLRFETSNRRLYELIHPPKPGDFSPDRIALLGIIKDLGFQVGSGVMVGIPGQTHRDLACDIDLFRGLGLHMIGVGPYIPHPQTPLHSMADRMRLATPDQVSATAEMAYKVVALSRIIRPQANIPSTTAIATSGGDDARMHALRCGANVLMPNVTPLEYRPEYEIYPSKAGSRQTPSESERAARQQIQRVGRRVGRGRGDSYTTRPRADCCFRA